MSIRISDKHSWSVIAKGRKSCFKFNFSEQGWPAISGTRFAFVGIKAMRIGKFDKALSSAKEDCDE